jgi:hypothetical protein
VSDGARFCGTRASGLSAFAEPSYPASGAVVDPAALRESFGPYTQEEAPDAGVVATRIDLWGRAESGAVKRRSNFGTAAGEARSTRTGSP